MLAKNQRHTVTITGWSAEGLGVARIGGQVVFVHDALRGEVCDIQILKVQKHIAYAKTVQVVTPSPARIQPDCPHFGRCGGCQFRHATYEEELEAKRQRVEDCLCRIGGWGGTVPGVYGAKNTERYRNKVQFPIAPDAIGFYAGRSHQVLDVPDCRLQGPGAAQIRAAVKDWMETYRVPAYDEATGTGLLRHLYVRSNCKGESLCCLVANGEALPQEADLVQRIRQVCPEIVGIVLNVNTARTNVILGLGYRTLWGQNWLEDTLCGLNFRLSVPSFYQVNAPQAEVLYNVALDFAGLTGEETVLDLYCGVGTISLVMAKRAKRVIGVEIVPAAVTDAEENARRNGVSHAQFWYGDAGSAASRFCQEGLRPDVVVVDPPRKGLSPQTIEAIAAMAPDRMVYVSCDPGTLARDVKALGTAGYQLEQVQPVDMFPRTKHVETVCRLSKLNAEHHY